VLFKQQLKNIILTLVECVPILLNLFNFDGLVKDYILK
jgi:hypothetical protein